MKNRNKGATRDLTFKYNQYVNEELDKNNSDNGSKEEIINKKNDKM